MRQAAARIGARLVTVYIGIDPGVRASGVAIIARGELVRAWWQRDEAQTVAYVLRGMLRKELDDVRVAIEMPRTYGGRARGGADANDLIRLAHTVGYLHSYLENPPDEVSSAFEVTLCMPDEWRGGSVPSDVMWERCKRSFSASELARVELPAKSYQHNVTDAVGIARWLAAKK
jgi:hypothetical protein